MSDDIIDKLRNAPRRPDCKHGNRPKSCLECDIEELEAENTASMTEIARLRAENERLSTKLSNTASARVLQGKAIAELSAENERLRDCLLGIGLPGNRIIYCRDGHEQAVLLARAALKENSE